MFFCKRTGAAGWLSRYKSFEIGMFTILRMKGGIPNDLTAGLNYPLSEALLAAAISRRSRKCA